MDMVDPHSCTRLLRSCKTGQSISQGKQIHLLLLKKGLDSAVFFANCLLQMYTRCGRPTDARRLFDEMPHRNDFSWNSMIEGYLKSGDNGIALELFRSMPHKNVFSWNAVITGFTKCGELETARQLFNEMPERNATAWNSIIHGYVRHGRPHEALWLFKSLSLDPTDSLQVDNFVLATIVGASANLAALDCGRQIHARIVVSAVELDLVLGSSLVNMYGKCRDLDSAGHMLDLMTEPDDFSLSALISSYADCGRLTDARRLFQKRNSQSVVVWNSMIAGCVSNNQGEEALELFNRMRSEMIRADPSTFANAFTACASLGVLENGKQVHAQACKDGIVNDMIASSTVVDMYSKCGSLDGACKFFSELREYDTILLNSMITVYSNCGQIKQARCIFDTMLFRSLISWNSMIVGYSQNGFAMEALELFCEMHRLDLRMDKVSLASIISTCAGICSLRLGEQIFAHATVVGLESDQVISTSLVNLYCKCGNVKDGRRVFEEMEKFNQVPWNVMLMGYAINGCGTEVLKLFEEMRNACVVPNETTFIGVLLGCGHCGMVEEGRRWFYAMKDDYHIEPTIEHYSCMIDLFARAGDLEEAMELIDRMPFKADTSIWSSVLRGSKARGDESLGRKAAERLIELDPENSGAYVQLSGIYAAHGEWERSALLRNMMQERRIKKSPGCSWVDG
eukprot:TRINITY_DN11127_c0_g2_i1.p1 TRINITY_DN11127_c0_g2~~TRINITY_DN11127_c0_g2_i1.p1  ORF type:complete len:682 (+),score=120.26 TRINITY_DN11127_c0_g2_i1:162-2207(+)